MEDRTTIIADAQRILAQSDLSSYAIARRAGVDLSQLRGFQRFGRGLSVRSLDKVLAAIGAVRLEVAGHSSGEPEPDSEQPGSEPITEQPPEQFRSAGSGLDDQFLSTLL